LCVVITAGGYISPLALLLLQLQLIQDVAIDAVISFLGTTRLLVVATEWVDASFPFMTLEDVGSPIQVIIPNLEHIRPVGMYSPMLSKSPDWNGFVAVCH
tara:strand:+ start:238 stop:537 length:300 start_codon:yes stop_codon:yes gene_type:complete